MKNILGHFKQFQANLQEKIKLDKVKKISDRLEQIERQTVRMEERVGEIKSKIKSLSLSQDQLFRLKNEQEKHQKNCEYFQEEYKKLQNEFAKLRKT